MEVEQQIIVGNLKKTFASLENTSAISASKVVSLEYPLPDDNVVVLCIVIRDGIVHRARQPKHLLLNLYRHEKRWPAQRRYHATAAVGKVTQKGAVCSELRGEASVA